MDNPIEAREGESSVTLVLPHRVLAGNMGRQNKTLDVLKLMKLGQVGKIINLRDIRTFRRSLGMCW